MAGNVKVNLFYFYLFNKNGVPGKVVVISI